jgi:predicted HTH transcriptional regulator
MQTMLRMVGFGDNAGSGFPTIVAVWDAEGWVKPELIEDTILNQVTLKLIMMPEWMENLQRLEQQIIENLGTNTENMQDIAKALQTSMGRLDIPKIDGIESAVKAFAQGLPILTNSQLEQMQSSLTIISEKFQFDKDLIYDSKKFADALAEKSAEKSAENTQSGITKRHKQILELMKADNLYSTEQIANEIGLKGPRTRQLLNELVDLGYLECLGTTKNRRYAKVR